MNCLAFERLLDASPERLSAEALAHARECAACARSLARARSLEAVLVAHFSADAGSEAVPAGFADRVLERVVRGEARGVRWLALPDAVPWWTRAAAEPGVALAAAAAALLLWREDRIVSGTRALWLSLAGAPGRVHELLLANGFGPAEQAIARAFAPHVGVSWTVDLGLLLGLAPLVALLGLAMWRAGEWLVEASAATALR